MCCTGQTALAAVELKLCVPVLVTKLSVQLALHLPSNVFELIWAGDALNVIQLGGSGKLVWDVDTCAY